MPYPPSLFCWAPTPPLSRPFQPPTRRPFPRLRRPRAAPRHTICAARGTPSVVPIRPTATSLATAFLLSPTHAVTALHALSALCPLRPSTPGPLIADIPTTVTHICTHADLALLTLTRPFPHVCISLLDTTPNPDTPCLAIPAPPHAPLPLTLATASIAPLRFSAALVPCLHLRASSASAGVIQPGWSGAPVCIASENALVVIGMIVQASEMEVLVIPSAFLSVLMQLPTRLFDLPLARMPGARWQGLRLATPGKQLRERGFRMGDLLEKLHTCQMDATCSDFAALLQLALKPPGTMVDVVVRRGDNMHTRPVRLVEATGAVHAKMGDLVEAGGLVFGMVNAELLREVTDWKVAAAVDWILVEDVPAALVVGVVCDGEVVFCDGVRDNQVVEDIRFARVVAVQDEPVCRLDALVREGDMRVAFSNGFELALPGGQWVTQVTVEDGAHGDWGREDADEEGDKEEEKEDEEAG